jgi:hypothetical protein
VTQPQKAFRPTLRNAARVAVPRRVGVFYCGRLDDVFEISGTGRGELLCSGLVEVRTLNQARWLARTAACEMDSALFRATSSSSPPIGGQIPTTKETEKTYLSSYRCAFVSPNRSGELPEKSYGRPVKVPVDSILEAHTWSPDGPLASAVQNCGWERAGGVYTAAAQDAKMEILAKMRWRPDYFGGAATRIFWGPS